MNKLILGLVVLAGVVFTLPASAAMHEHSDHCEHLLSGKDFGAHVAMHAKEGHLGPEMNPGMHKGYSPCANLNP